MQKVLQENPSNHTNSPISSAMSTKEKSRIKAMIRYH